MICYQHLGYSSFVFMNYLWILITAVTYLVFLHLARNHSFSVKGDLPPRDLWQYLEVFLVITTGRCYGVKFIEARGATKHCIVCRRALSERII